MEKFIVKSRSAEKVLMTLRIARDLQEEFDELAAKSDCSRNALMCMALQYALEHLEFTPKCDENKNK